MDYGLLDYFDQKQQFEVNNIAMMDLFLTTHSFGFLRCLTDRLEWCGLTCGLL